MALAPRIRLEKPIALIHKSGEIGLFWSRSHAARALGVEMSSFRWLYESPAHTIEGWSLLDANPDLGPWEPLDDMGNPVTRKHPPEQPKARPTQDAIAAASNETEGSG